MHRDFLDCCLVEDGGMTILSDVIRLNGIVLMFAYNKLLENVLVFHATPEMVSDITNVVPGIIASRSALPLRHKLKCWL